MFIRVIWIWNSSTPMYPNTPSPELTVFRPRTWNPEWVEDVTTYYDAKDIALFSKCFYTYVVFSHTRLMDVSCVLAIIARPHSRSNCWKCILKNAAMYCSANKNNCVIEKGYLLSRYWSWYCENCITCVFILYNIQINRREAQPKKSSPPVSARSDDKAQSKRKKK